MQIPGNMWSEVWQSAKPVPVRRQKRLFDDTKEAEKVCTTFDIDLLSFLFLGGGACFILIYFCHSIFRYF